MTGKRFDRLLVTGFAGISKDNRAVWHCRCDCGKEVDVIGKSLRSGNTHSCGCLNVENSTKRIVTINTKHGKAHTRLFRVWSSMLTRCENPKATNYHDYGMRGITVCDEWRNDFEAFYQWAIKHGYDASAKRGEYTIDRIDYDKGYSPDNCRFANYLQQADNRRSTRHITFGGKTMNLSEWARHYGRKNIFHGMSDAEIIERITAYENYLTEHHTDVLPKRVAI
jgi:hypothetical protein